MGEDIRQDFFHEKQTMNFHDYARHHSPHLNTNQVTIQKDRIFSKNLLENKEMDFKNGVENIQTAGNNGACTVTI